MLPKIEDRGQHFTREKIFHDDQHASHYLFCYLTLPYGVDRLLHLPSAEAVSARPNARPRM